MRRFIIFVLTLILFSIWLSVFTTDIRLKVIACDVGQGDAILIQKNTDQILIDGGPNSKVLDCLGKYMPFWDREIELLILTHPDKDHSGGVVDVNRLYRIQNLLTNDLNNPLFSTDIVRVIQKEVGGKGVNLIYPSDTKGIRLGMIYLDILHPGVNFHNNKTNNYSIVTLLKYDDFEALFTGDIEDEISDEIAKRLEGVDIDYIKTPHHGSKNGLSENLLRATNPEVAVISVGKNSYGHPSREVLDLLTKYNIQVKRTDQNGDVVEVAD